MFGIAHDEQRLTAAASNLSEHEPGTFASLCVDVVAPDAPAIVACEIEERWVALDRALLPLLKNGTNPRIVNVGSGAGTMHGLTEPGIGSYRLSKWALHGMTMLEA